MIRNLLLTFTTLTVFCAFAFGQQYSKPKKLKVEGDYVQEATNILFPIAIDNYERADIYSFDKKRTNIGVTYKNKNGNRKTTLSIYIYPAGSGTEDRVRNEYLNCLQSLANVADHGIQAVQNYCSYKKDGYTFNGFKATVVSESKTKSLLEIYECGNWFFKIRVTSDLLDSLALDSLDKRVLELFPLEKLVKISFLHSRANVYFAKGALRDSILLGCAMGSAYKKIEWAFDNTDSLERAAGFPGLYLDLHVAAWKEFVKFQKEHDYKMSSFTKDYLAQLNSIIDNGFLEEFIMEQYSMIMIIPENMKNEFGEFDKWKLTHPVTINLNERFYVIELGDKK